MTGPNNFLKENNSSQQYLKPEQILRATRGTPVTARREACEAGDRTDF
jgi:hypothetical protein